MQRSIATAAGETSLPQSAQRTIGGRLEGRLESADPALIGLLFVAVALAVYLFSNGSRSGFYNHFVWQADAFLDGRVAITYPVVSGPVTNGYFQDVMPLPSAPGEPGYGLLPFPPLPAVLLVPFVAIFGLATDSQLVGVVLGAINVGLAWRLTTRVTEDRGAALLGTVFFAFGTVHWYAAMLSTTWFLAHVVATTFTLLAITLALDAERRAAAAAAVRRIAYAVPRAGRSVRHQIDPVQFMAGFVFGVAALSRLTVLFAAPFFLFVGGGGSIWRRGSSAGVGAIIPVALLVTYNVVATGHVFNPAYEYLYQTEYLGYMPPDLQINRDYAIEDIRHVPVNMLIMFLWPPIIDTVCTSLLNRDCPLIRPSEIGMSVLLTSPAYLLGIVYAIRNRRERIVVGASLAVIAVALVNLMHFSQGWVQFGYRFSNDFAPFALLLVTLGIAATTRARALAVVLVAASVLVNAWGVYWGVALGW